MKLSIENMRIEKKYEHNCVGKFKLKEEVMRSGKFKTGVNFLVGKIDDITWPFVYTIARGKSCKNNAEVYVNGKKSSFSDLQKSTYYLAYREDKFPHNILRTTLKQHLARSLRKKRPSIHLMK